jgi:hypothetical protein
MAWCFFTLVFLRVAGLLARVATELASAERTEAERTCEEQTEAELACAEQTQKERTELEQIFWAAGLSSGLQAASCCTVLPVCLPEFWPGGHAPVLQNCDHVQVEFA